MLKRFSFLFLPILICFQLVCAASVSAKETSIVNPRVTYTYDMLTSDLAELSAAYPGLIRTELIGKSEYGRNIYAVALGSGPGIAHINGSVHAREWISTNINMNMIEDYARAYVANAKIGGYDVRTVLNQSTIWFIPMVNPDGVELQQFGLSKFPKQDQPRLLAMNGGSNNFKRWKANAKGVDINRNFDGDWRYIQLNPGKPSYQFYSGPRALSAKESVVLYNFTLRINPEMVISYHSAGKVIYWWFLQQGEQKKRDYAYAESLGQLTGYRLMPDKNDTSAGGTHTDWVRNRLKKPAFTIELCNPVYQSNPSISEFDGEYKRNRSVGLFTAAESYKLWAGRNAPLIKAAASKEKQWNADIEAFKANKDDEAAYNQLKEAKNLLVGSYLAIKDYKRALTVQQTFMALGFYTDEQYKSIAAIDGASRQQTIRIYVDDQPVALSEPAFIEKGAAYIPLRDIAERLGASVSFNPEKQSIAINKDSRELLLYRNESYAEINGEKVALAYNVRSVKNTTFVPLRFVTEQLQMEVRFSPPSVIRLVKQPQ
jgi:murein tripeptide amidase MpaA